MMWGLEFRGVLFRSTGLTIGTQLRHHYTTGKGVKIIAEGPITGYGWGRDLQVDELFYDATPETRAAGGFRQTRRPQGAFGGAPGPPAPRPAATPGGAPPGARGPPAGSHSPPSAPP